MRNGKVRYGREITSSPKNACATLDRALGHRAGLEVACVAAWVGVALSVVRCRCGKGLAHDA